jgi:DNA-binding MarR family transcriptional regulator
VNRSGRRNDFLLRSLLHAVYWVDESLQSSMEASGLTRIPRSWSLVLVNLADGVTRPTKLAQNIGVSRQAMHKTLEEMARQGLIDVRQDPQDKRANIVAFSRKAERLQRAALSALAHIESELAARIGGDKLDALKDALASDWGPLIVEPVKGVE